MNDRLTILSWIVLTLFVSSCNTAPDHNIDFESVKLELLQDPSFGDHKELIDSAIAFYKRELPDHYSRRVSLGSARNMVYLDELSDGQIDSIRDQLGSDTRIRIETIADSRYIEEEYLANRIRHALTSMEKYPWNQSIPDSIFLNYLLPYKVMDEYPGLWWEYLEPHYRDSMIWWSSPAFDRFDVSDSYLVERFTTFYMGDLPEWWYYDAIAQTYTQFPSLNEILLLRYGGCQMESMINTMIQRTWGIPATIDEVPYWGSVNGSHTVEVNWNAREGRMYGELKLYNPEIRRRPAKVIRHCFRNTGAYTNFIAPWIDGEELQIPQMRTDHWFDVTAEHGPVMDVIFPVGDNWPDKTKLGYIYVMNYGKWVPIHYGTLQNDSLRFRSMGKDIIYRVGYFANGNHQFISQPFLLDLQGEMKSSAPDPGHTVDLNARKINHGSKAGVEPGVTYTLQYLDSDGKWLDHATEQCQQEEVLWFTDVPSHAFYRLKFPTDEWNLARIFLVDDDGEQVWY